tara:strand:- start:7436 stop:7912 length:477 start_codon:yes stop_codon:yes gene_type:complete
MLNGKNILLRSLKISDLSFLKQIENNKSNWRYGSENVIYSDSDLINFIINSKQNIKKSKQLRFVIDKYGLSIGFVDLYDYKEFTANIGIIIDKEYRRNGFGKEALNLISYYAFSSLKINKLYAMIHSSNHSSISLFRSTGFKLFKTQKQFQYFIKLAS